MTRQAKVNVFGEYLDKGSDRRSVEDEFLSRFCFQPALTTKLDSLSKRDFTQEIIDEIVLWKVNRYVAMNNALLHKLNALKTLLLGEHRKAETVLFSLLKTPGVDLPMASTMLRFRNPSVFQIIDRHAFRAIYGKKYRIYTTTPLSRKVDCYFDYLDKLALLCRVQGLHFESIDRLLYQFDKELNGKLTNGSE